MRVQRINDVSAIRDEVEIPGLGALPINAFLLHAEQPLLVDTGRPVVREEFLDAVRSVIDPAEIRWIWLTHPDRDHMGALMDLFRLAPNARLVSNFMAVGYLTVEFEMPLDRVFLLNPGQTLDIGDRRLRAFRPPTFDSPMTVGFYDESTGTCFSSDCFGAPMPTLEAAQSDDVSTLDPAEVRAAQLMWIGADSPWVCNADPAKFAVTYEHLREFKPERILSTHLPPAHGQLDRMLDMLGDACDTAPFVGPDQAQLEAMLAGMVPDQQSADEQSQPIAT
jgi:glyoxylase-like metal-dependent hydrolase (beta-lactamase superfamily II)